MGVNLTQRGWHDVNAANPGEFRSLPAGGYVCFIVNAEITKSKTTDRDMLVLFLDIAEGDFKGYFRDATNRAKKFNPDKKWDNNGIYRQPMFDINGKVAGFFKGILLTIEQSNSGFNINPDNFEPSSLKGKFCGFVFREEQYYKRDGQIGSAARPSQPKTVDDIRDANFDIPAPLPPKDNSQANSALPYDPPVDNDANRHVPEYDMPF